MFGFSECPKRSGADVQHPMLPAVNSVPQTNSRTVRVKRELVSLWLSSAFVLYVGKVFIQPLLLQQAGLLQTKAFSFQSLSGCQLLLIHLLQDLNCLH